MACVGRADCWVGGGKRAEMKAPKAGKGAWHKYTNIDMCCQGDVEVVYDWKRHHTIASLKKIVEEKGYSAMSIGSFGHAALKDFDFALTPQHCKRASGYTCTIHIYNPPTPKPAGGPKPRLILVKPGDRRACVFEHAAALRTSPLDLTDLVQLVNEL